jgi:hypothetical protein
VIPILLEGAKIPKPAQLPEELEDLSVRNGLEVRHASFHSDMDRLIQNIKKNALESKTGGESPVTALGFGKFFAFTQNRTAMIGGTLAMITLISGLLIWTVGTDHIAIAPRKELAPVPIPVPSPPEPLLSPSATRAPSPAPTTPTATTAAPTPVTPTAVATPPVPSAAPMSASPTTVTVMPPVTSDQNVGDPKGADVVRAFYTALGHGDGTAAAKLVVPERQKGHLDPKEMTKFFSSFSDPLRLLSVEPRGQNAFQATYTYRAGSSVCNNTVLVITTQRNGQYLIERIEHSLSEIDVCHK